MQLFYDPDLTEGTHQLRDEEARHAFQVLRKKTGDELDLVDGRGGWYKANVLNISKRDCTLEVTFLRREASRAEHQIKLLVAPTKNIDRLEWVLEKCTEIGIDQIQPFISEHSERKKIRPDRLERILESAMKQSLRAWKPELLPLLPFKDAVAQTQTDAPAAAYLAYLGADATPLLHQTAGRGGQVAVAIGPEGGFSPAEAALAQSHGFSCVSLGPNRLRTETAAITAVHTLNQLYWS